MMLATGLSGLAVLVAAAAANVEIQDGKLQAISSAGIAESTIECVKAGHCDGILYFGSS